VPNLSLKKNEMPVLDAKYRSTCFEEVATGYTEDQALDEANRCLNCKNKPCVSGCPVAIDIPAFIMRIRKKTLKAHTMSSIAQVLFRLFADGFARRNRSAKKNVLGESKANQLQSEDWNALWLITIWHMQKSRTRLPRTDLRLLW